MSILLSLTPEALTPERFHDILQREFLHMAERRTPDGRFYVFLDSLERLFEAMGPENTLRMAEMCLSTLWGTNSTAVALLCNEFVSEDLVETASALASLSIELKREWKGKEIQRMARVMKPRPRNTSTNWVTWYY